MDSRPTATRFGAQRVMMKMATTPARFSIPFGILAAGLLVLAGCQRPPDGLLAGYVEGEYVYVAAAMAGRLETLHVRRGQAVKTGEPLFNLELEPEQSRLAEAESRVQSARAILSDLRKGRRDSEQASVRAQLAEAEAALVLATADLKRQLRLTDSQAVSVQERDRAVAVERQSAQRVNRIRAELETAELGARADQVAAADAEIRTLEAVAVRARWELSQKQCRSAHDASVHDTLYGVGEWVPAGKPVVVLLPPGHIKIRIFVPESRLGGLHLGDRASVKADGDASSSEATVAFIATRAEYTPPVLYSRNNRARLVYLVELSLPPADAIRFHPGQPVDVSFLAR